MTLRNEPTEREWLEGLRYEDKFPDNPVEINHPHEYDPDMTSVEWEALSEIDALPGAEA